MASRLTPEEQARVEKSRASYMNNLQRRIDRLHELRMQREAARQSKELEAARVSGQLARDKAAAGNDKQNTILRANIAADAASADFERQKILNEQQQTGTLRRDRLQNEFQTNRDRYQTKEQAERDARQYGYSQQQDQRQFENQLLRDATQQGYQTDRDRLQQQQTLQRDLMQFGLDSRRMDQQQQNTIQRDMLQYGQQESRDRRLNSFDRERDLLQQEQLLERDSLQNRFQTDRDQRMNQFDTARDERQQGFTRENMFQREASEISARWQEQIQQARNAGLDFSEKQKQRIKQLDSTFREKVLSSSFPEDLKMRAMVEHQKALAAIVPEERIQTNQEGFEGSLVVDPQTGGRFLVHRDSRGFPVYEPIQGPDNGQNRMVEMQQRQQEQEAARRRDADFERDDKWQKTLDRVSTMTDAEGNPLYTPDQAMSVALREFAPIDRKYQQYHGLEPHWAYEPQQPNQPQNPPMAGEQQQQLPPIQAWTEKLPESVSARLKTMPRGAEIQALRDRHSSSSGIDQTVRLAANLYINAVLTGDTSDPDFPEALDVLKNAGFKLGQ